jgi:hypothetical protein
MMDPCNCYTIALLIINHAQHDWSCLEGFTCKRLEHKQEREKHNLVLQREMKYINLIGGSSLQMEGLIDTTEEEQERESWFTTIKLGVTSAMKNVYFTIKIRTQQNPNH